jgi:conjugal transfer/entry exclusion protein
MIEQDTIRLLRECDAGVKMGVKSIDDVLKYTHSSQLQKTLSDCKREHEKIDTEIQEELDKYQDEGKNPNPMAKGMSKMKTAMKIAVNESDKTVADLITDGCNMGVKSLSKYLNEYKAADERSKDIAKRLIDVEHNLAVDMRGYL